MSTTLAFIILTSGCLAQKSLKRVSNTTSVTPPQNTTDPGDYWNETFVFNGPSSSNSRLVIILSALATVLFIAIFCIGLRFGTRSQRREIPAAEEPDFSDTVIRVVNPVHGDYVGVRVIRAGDEGYWIPNDSGIKELLERYMEPLPVYTSPPRSRARTTSSTSIQSTPHSLNNVQSFRPPPPTYSP